MEVQKIHFGIYDYLVFGCVLLFSSAIGIYFRFSGGKQKTFKEYLLADQKMSVIPVAFSLMASFMSAITILGVSKEIYSFGTQFILINISYIISTPIVCYIFLPVFYRLQKISVYEYLEMRFGRVTRLFASLAFSLQMTLYMGIVLYAPSLALAAVTGISETWSIIAVGVVCTFYSSIGGMKAVLITDVFQSLLMFAAVFAVGITGLFDFGLVEILNVAAEGDRLEFFNVEVDPRVRHTVWSLGIGGVFTYCSLYGVNQAQVQRLLTVRSLKKAQGSLWLQWIILMCLSLSTSFSGLVLYAQYRSCDPLLSKQISNSDQLLPFYVVQRLGRTPGVSGLFVSGIFSGSLSTVSSSLNSLSAVTLHDYIMPFFPSLTSQGEGRAASMGKLISVLYGILCMCIAFMSKYLGTGILQASLTIFGAVGGPLLCVFTLGMLSKTANQKGVVMGLIVGLSLTLWIGFGQPKPSPPYKPRSTDGCPPNFNLTVAPNGIAAPSLPKDSLLMDPSNTSLTSELDDSASLGTMDINEDSNPLHELYALSYMWVATLGFLSTLIVGLLTSWATGGNSAPIDSNLLCSLVWTKQDKALVLDVLSSKTEATKL